MTYPFVLVVTDGVVIRTLHRPAFNTADQHELDALIWRNLHPPEIDRPLPTTGQIARTPQVTPVQTAREQGYEGVACDNCGEWKMKRSGPCLVCAACGTTTGCS